MKITVEDLIEAQTSPDKMAKLEGGELEVTGSLDLRALTSLPANAKLTAGGYLDLSGVPQTERRDHKGGNPAARGIEAK